jgi:DNA-3-methyladenine glycosylase II
MEAMANTYHQAQRHLARRDPVLRELIRQIGSCTLQPCPDHFPLLVRSIVSQQISGKAAASISARLEQTLGGSPTPAAILAAAERKLRTAGLSSNKLRSLRDLAEKVENGTVPLDSFPELDDEAVISRLVEVRGIGRWTAQMFLIFSLGRPDVLPVDDFGLRSAARRLYRLRKLPDRERLTRLAGPWAPYRTVATWYMWRSQGAVPQSD